MLFGLVFKWTTKSLNHNIHVVNFFFITDEFGSYYWHIKSGITQREPPSLTSPPVPAVRKSRTEVNQDLVCLFQKFVGLCIRNYFRNSKCWLQAQKLEMMTIFSSYCCFQEMNMCVFYEDFLQQFHESVR